MADEDALTWAGDPEDRASGSRASSSSRKPAARKPAAKKPAAKYTDKKPATKKPLAEKTVAVETGPVVHPSVLGERPVAENSIFDVEPTFDELVKPDPPAQMPGWALVIFGLFAGVYLLFSVAWLIIALNPPIAFADPVASFMWVASLWFAACGGIIWFIATLILGRYRNMGWRIFMLLLGAAVLIPWPYLHLAVK